MILTSKYSLHFIFVLKAIDNRINIVFFRNCRCWTIQKKKKKISMAKQNTKE